MWSSVGQTTTSTSQREGPSFARLSTQSPRSSAEGYVVINALFFPIIPGPRADIHPSLALLQVYKSIGTLSDHRYNVHSGKRVKRKKLTHGDGMEGGGGGDGMEGGGGDGMEGGGDGGDGMEGGERIH